MDKRTAEVFQYQLKLTEKDVIPLHLKYGMVSPMLAETPICDMNEPTYCRIEMSYNEAQCSTSILPTVLQLDELFHEHSISLSQVLHYLLSCNKCRAMCYSNWETEGVQPYLVEQFNNLEEQYMTESQGLLTDLKSSANDVASVVHHLGSIEMWRNRNENDDPEYEEDWYSSDTQK